MQGKPRNMLIVNDLRIDGQTLTDFTVIANEFGAYFSSNAEMEI